MILLVPEAINIDVFSAHQAMLEGRRGTGHVGSAVAGGCLREEGSSTTRFVGVIMAAIVGCVSFVQFVGARQVHKLHEKSEGRVLPRTRDVDEERARCGAPKFMFTLAPKRRVLPRDRVIS